jgi:hypothetical protein
MPEHGPDPEVVRRMLPDRGPGRNDEDARERLGERVREVTQRVEPTDQDGDDA